MYILIYLFVGALLAFFLVFFALEKKWYKPVYAAAAYAGIYVLLRLLGYNTWLSWIDVAAWTSLLSIALVPILTALRKRPILSSGITVLLVLVSLLGLLVNGLATEKYWLSADYRYFIAHTPHGNLVAIDGADYVSGYDRRKYSLRREILWGALFKEYDSQYLTADCDVWLGNPGAQVHYDDCKKQVIFVE